MAGEDWHYLRFPNLTLDDQHRAAALAFVGQRGYKVADVSVAKGDEAAIASMKRQYLRGVERGNSMQVYGRCLRQSARPRGAADDCQADSDHRRLLLYVLYKTGWCTIAPSTGGRSLPALQLT